VFEPVRAEYAGLLVSPSLAELQPVRLIGLRALCARNRPSMNWGEIEMLILIQWKPLNVITVMLSALYCHRSHLLNIKIQTQLVIVIIMLVLSVPIHPKVITISSFHCTLHKKCLSTVSVLKILNQLFYYFQNI